MKIQKILNYVNVQLACFCAAAALGFSNIAAADISLTYQSIKNPAHRSTILISDNAIRFENPMAPDFFMLFEVKKQYMTLVDSEKKSYSILDRETLDSLSEQIEATRKAIVAELEAGIKVASPEDKEQMQEILDQMQQLAEAPEQTLVEYHPLNSNQEINGYPCQMIEVKVSGESQATLCAANASDIDIPESIMATLESFHHFSSSVHKQLNPGDATELLFIMDSQQQLPVSIQRTQPPSAADEYRLAAIRTTPIPESAFKIPEGYQAKDIEDAFIVD